MKETVLEEPVHTIQQILKDHFDDYIKSSSRRLRMTDHIFKTVNQILSCRTPRLGVYLVGCKCCGQCTPIPRSCKNRFCSKCGSADTLNWVSEISKKVPDIKHYHFVFTLPAELRVLARRNMRLFYNLLFTSSQLAVKEVFAGKYNLQPGLISVLHTNGSDLKYHPHVHMIVSAGGFTVTKELKELTEDFLVPQRRLANMFRREFMTSLRKSIKSGSVNLPQSLHSGKGLKNYLGKVSTKQWIVNIEDPIKGAEKIIAYVGRYTKKSCISERRILSVKDGKVELSYKDYKNSPRGEKPKDSIKIFTIIDFLDRLLQHVPIKGFKVVRYYGMYSSSNWKHIPEELRIKDLNLPLEEDDELFETIGEYDQFTKYRKSMIRKTGLDPMYCYACELEMKLIELTYERSDGRVLRLIYVEGEVVEIDDG